MNDLDVLKGMRELISDPAHFSQNAYARDVNGQEVYSLGDEAVSFCLYGAERRVSRGLLGGRSERLHRLLGDAIDAAGHPTQELAQFNDNHSHDQVLEVLDLAIQLETERMLEAA
jgi:hypothetical protein